MKKQENMIYSIEKNKPVEAIPEKPMVGLLDKGFKATTLKMLKDLKRKTRVKVKAVMYEQNGNISKKIEIIKKKEILELKSMRLK